MLNRLLGLAHRQGQPLCFALIDLDNFKQINDRYGHPVGDRVLKRFGDCLKSTFRDEDVIGRWGGEEFVVGFYGMSRQEGAARLQNFLQRWRQERFEPTVAASNQSSHFITTFSAGVTVYPQDATDIQSLYQAADEALYQAKGAGRNQVRPMA